MTIDARVDMIYFPPEYNYEQILSKDLPDKEIFSYNHELEYILGFWGSYICGAVKALQYDYVLKFGLDAVVSG